MTWLVGTWRRCVVLTGILLVCASGVVSQAMQIPKPSPGLMPNPVIGKMLFGKGRAACHGVDLKGSDKGPPLPYRIDDPSHHSDSAFQLAAKNESRAHHWNFGDTPPVPDVSPDEVAHITAYVRSEQRKAGME